MKTIQDKNGQFWIHCTDGVSVPSYSIDKNIEQQIQKNLDSEYYQDDEIQQFMLKLPFFSFPMWPKTKKDIKNVADFCFCICLKCGKLISGPACLYLSFNVVQHSNTKYTILWRPRLSCCDKIGFNKTYFPLISMVASLLKPVFKKAMKTFSNKTIISKTKCYVCEDDLPCDNDICTYLSDKIPTKSTPDDHMFDLMMHFKNIKLDILSCLCENRCCNYGCNKKMSSVICKHCRRVVYCSKKCKNEDLNSHNSGGCENFLKIWNW